MPTLLVVDEDEQVREFLRKSLSKHLTVIEAADGAQGVEAARWSKPHVVVLDLEVPVVDGFEAARRIKAAPETSSAILIAVTGATAENAVPRARAAGFSYFVHKQASAKEFVEKVARLVREAAATAPPSPEAPAAPKPRARRRAKAAK